MMDLGFKQRIFLSDLKNIRTTLISLPSLIKRKDIMNKKIMTDKKLYK